MTLSEMNAIIAQISYKPGWRIELHDDGRPYIQVVVGVAAEAAVDAVQGGKLAWKGGKRYLSPHMCRQEVVGAAFAALMAAEEHEAREWFRYRGVSIYNPHLDPDALALFASVPENYNTRDS